MRVIGSWKVFGRLFFELRTPAERQAVERVTQERGLRKLELRFLTIERSWVGQLAIALSSIRVCQTAGVKI